MPPRIRRLPARYLDPDVQVESPTIHQFDSGVACSSTSTSRSATPGLTSAPTPVTVASQMDCLTPRTESFSLNASREISEHPVNLGDDRVIPEAEAEAEAEAEVEANTSGLDITPKYEPNLSHMYAPDTEHPKPRWVPPGIIGPPNYDDLSDGAKVILLREMTHHMTFKTAVSFLELTDTQIAEFVHIYERECTRDKTEKDLLESAMSRIIRIRMNRAMTDVERRIILDEEVTAKLPAESCLLSITNCEIEKAIAFLQSFRVQEEHSVVEEQTLDGLRIVEPDDIPPYLIVAEIVEKMREYARLGTTFTWDHSHDMGLWDYLIVEFGMVGNADDDDVLGPEIVIEDKDEDETWQPPRRPVGRPRGSKTNKGRRLLTNKSSILKLRLASEKSQDIRSASNTKRPGRPVSRLS